MNPVAHRLSWSSLILALVIVAGCGSDARSAAVDDGHRRYHDGQRWIEVEVAFDRIQTDIAPVSKPGGLKAGPEQGGLQFADSVASVAELNAKADEHRRSNPDVSQVYACLYAPGVDRDKTPPMRLTRRLTLTGAPGQDLAALAAKHDARVIEKVDYRPDTVICEATGPSLLAALDAANALREEPGVVAATPLIARQHQPRSR